MKNTRTYAKLSGWSLILMAILAGFSFGFVFPKIYDASNLDLAQDNMMANVDLYQQMIIGIILVILLDIFVSFTLYWYFKNTHKQLAFTSFVLRMIYSFVFAVATFYLAKSIGQENLSNAIIVENYQLFQLLWSIGLVIFGVHLLTIGVLMKLHAFVPKVLWYLTLIAGVSYMLVHILKVAAPQMLEFNNMLEAILGLPMALGELLLAVWLVAKGGKQEKV